MEIQSPRLLKLQQDRLMKAMRAASKLGTDAAQRSTASKQVIESFRRLAATVRRRR